MLPAPPRSFAPASPVAQVAGAVRPKLDEYQQAVVECNDKIIVVGAYAGAGKTTMAIGYAAARPRSNVLYLCFGKANQLDAEARFGSNTKCRTVHSLAYAAVGHKFKDQLVFNWRVRDFAAQLNHINVRTAAVVQDVLNSFFSSTDKLPDTQHLADAAEKWDLMPNEFDAVLSLSKTAWAKMQIPGSGFSIPPDAYLKMWALTHPKLSAYSHIILDEAQDTNPVTAQIVAEQVHAHRLLVGDRHQSIFLFRGALNAMETFAATGATCLNMPRTWRFGPRIANVANDLLGFFKNEDVKIIGAGPGSPRRNDNKRAVLSRTNVGVYGEAAAVMGKKTHWLGGIEQYKIDALQDSYLLKTGRRSEIRDANMRNYASWGQFIDESERTRDGASRMLIKLNDQYGKDIPYLVKCFRANELKTEAGAELVLSTVHRAKGLDFDNVVIADDFDCTGKAFDELKLQPDTGLSPVMAQEINLLYVGITRAKHGLQLNKATSDFFAQLPNHQAELMEIRAKHASTTVAEEAPAAA
jgi:F-box protein 18 (helicase)